jgi:hypothetical protein
MAKGAWGLPQWLERGVADLFPAGEAASDPDQQLAARLAQAIRAGSYSIGDFQTSGAARPGWFGRLIDWSKERLFGRRY